MDTLDLDAATERGVICAHVPDVNRREVANHALMLMLAVTRKLIVQDRAIPRRRLDDRRARADAGNSTSRRWG